MQLNINSTVIEIIEVVEISLNVLSYKLFSVIFMNVNLTKNDTFCIKV